jgi:hypothetical protein
VLFATASKADKHVSNIADPRGSDYGKSRKPLARAAWRHLHFPVYPWAMVAGGKYLVVAGPPSQLQAEDPWATFEGRAGGGLYILDSGTGKAVSRLDLESPPVWDGMAAAGGRLFVSTSGNTLMCLDER